MSDESSVQVGRGNVLRVVVLVLAGLATAAMLGIVGLVLSSGQLNSGEQLSRTLGWALLLVYGIPWVACILPALVLGILNRWLPLALALCLAAGPLLYIIFQSA
jgi:hypothetical protein